MKIIRKILSISTVLLALWTVVPTSYAQLVQFPTASTGGDFHWMLYDPHVENRIIGAVDKFTDEELPSLYISEDNGKNWRLLFEFTDSIRQDWEPVKGTIMNLQVKKNRNTIYFQVDNSSSSYTRGLYSVNHRTGKTKHYLLPNADMASSLRSYDVYDENGDTVLLNTVYMYGTIPVSEVFYTTDGGENWELIYYAPEYDYVTVGNVAFTPGSPNKIFLMRHGAQFGVEGGILISEDAGKTWTEQLLGRQWGPIAFNPTDPNEIYIGTHINYMNREETLLHSVDGGKTWKEVPVEYNDFVLNNFTDIEFDPHDPNKIIVIEENQIFITDNGFQTYENLMPDNGAYMWGLYASINPFNTDEMWIGNDGHNVWHTLDRGRTLSNVGGAKTGSGYTSAGTGTNNNSPFLYFTSGKQVIGLDPQKATPDFMLDSIYTDRIFTDPDNGNRFFLTDTSHTRLYFVERNGNTANLYLVKSWGQAQSISAIVPEAGADDRYLAAIGSSLYRLSVSTPANINLSLITTPGENPIAAVATAPTAFYMAKGGKIYKSTDQGSNWTEKTNGLTGITEITSLALDPDHNDRLLLSAGNKLYRSTDAAQNWISVLDGYQADHIAFSPLGDNRIMAASYTRPEQPACLLYSIDGGTEWKTVSSHALQYATTRSIAFEFGRTDTLVAHIASPDMGRLAYIIPLNCTDEKITDYPWYESFEAGLPLCWQQESINGNASWQTIGASAGSPATAPEGSGQKLQLKSETDASVRLVLPELTNLDSLENPMISLSCTLPERAGITILYKTENSAKWEELPCSFLVSSPWNTLQALLPESSESCILAIEVSVPANTEVQLDNFKIKESHGLPCHEVRDLTADIAYGAVNLHWIAPESNYKTLYNIYRNGALLAGNVPTTTYRDSLMPVGEHTYKVCALCLDKETAGREVTANYTANRTPAKNLKVETHNGIEGNIIATLDWDIPTGYTQSIYNLYRDNELIAKNLTENRYIDHGFITDGEHEWCVATVYAGEETEEKACIKAACANICAPARDLEISYDILQKKVDLNWSKPGALPQDWLTYSYEPENAIGTLETGTYSITAASRWTAAELKSMGLDGAKITELAFAPATERASYNVMVWIGGDGTQPGNQKAIARRLGHQITANEWNTVVLDFPVTIDASQELWIGYETEYTGGSYAIGCDAGPGAKGKNMIDLGTEAGWQPLEMAIDNAPFNLSIAARIEMPEGKKSSPMAKTDESIRYKVYRDNELLITTKETSFSESGLDEDIYHYRVTAVHANGCESPAIEQDFFAGNACETVGNMTVTSLKTGGAEIEWEVAKPYDSTRIVLYENFDNGIPDTWLKLDKDGDGRMWMNSDEAVYYSCNPYKGTGCVFSDVQFTDEYFNTILSNPDNWMVSPKIDLTAGNALLRYHVSNLYMFSYQTYYEVLLSTTGTDYEDFHVIDSDTLEQTSADVWYEKTVDLSAYTGTVYIAFRHLNDSMDVSIGVQIDEVSVEEIVPIPRKYNIYRDGEQIAANIEGSSYQDLSAPAGKHEWCVRAVCNELGHESNPACAETYVTVGNETGAAAVSLRVLPNPTTGRITVESPGKPMQKLRLADTRGKILLQQETLNAESFVFDLSPYASGIYFLYIDGELLKVVKQ